MKSIEEIKEELKHNLSKERYEHSIGAMEKAIELAKIYKIDEKKAAYTALVHDIAKEMSIEEYYKYVKENNINLSEDDKMCPSVIHGIIGAHISKVKYGFDEEMCKAIYYHTTGIPNMTLLGKIVYIADKIEDRTRDSEYASILRRTLKDKGLDDAIIECMDMGIFWYIGYHLKERDLSKKKIIHPNTINARNYILINRNLEN